MQKIKRGGSNLVSLKENKMTCNNGGQTIDSLIAGDVHGDSNQDFYQDFWGELSQEVASTSSKIVVSIAVSNGNSVLFACSGIAIERQGHVTRFLTSANLARALNDKTKDHDNLKVEVRHEGNVVIGFLGKCAFDLGIAVVNVMAFLDVQVVLLDYLMEFLPYSKVVAVGRDISGKLMATSGMLTPYTSGSEDTEDLMLSTCKISEAWEGGPLFDVEGNFVGMNLFFEKDRTLFLPTSIIFGRWVEFQMSLRTSKFLAQLETYKAGSCIKFSEGTLFSNKSKRIDDLGNKWKKNKRACNGGGKTSNSLISGVLNEDPFWHLDSRGYEKLPMHVQSDHLVLVNTFEDTFGDIYGGGGVWSELSETVSSNISQNVVSLASFYGGKRIFACTGFFIELNGCATILTSASLVSAFVGDKKIAENLRIEVLLPNKERRVGALQHYSLHYNVALVNVMDFSAPHPANIQQQKHNDSNKLVAVGYCFESGILMAATGQHAEMSGSLDCKLLQYSSCKITKAGIGGPLVNFDGKFVGMNFCGMNCYRRMSFDSTKASWTPFLSSDVILNVLEYLKTKPTVAEVGVDGYAHSVLDWAIDGDVSSVHPNSWPVPEAKYYPRTALTGEALILRGPSKHGRRPDGFRPPIVRIMDGMEVRAM